MKRFFISALSFVMMALILCSAVFAAEAPQVAGIRFTPPADIDRFLELGQTPDFTNSVIEVIYTDSSVKKVTYTEELLTWQTDAIGRRGATITVEGVPFKEFFIVSDKSIDVTKFTDVTKKYWAYNQIKHGVQAGFFVGVSDTLFDVSAGMTRAQFCQMIYNIYKDDVSVLNEQKSVKFTDVSKKDWFYKAVTACAKADIVNGVGDGTFNPNAYITRQDVAVIMTRIIVGTDLAENIDIEKTLENAKKSGIVAKDFDTTADYAKPYVASALGLIYFGDTNGNINPLDNITRAECAAMVDNYYFADYDEKDEQQNDADRKKIVYISPESSPNRYANYDAEKHPDYTETAQMQKLAKKLKKLLVAKGYEVHIADNKKSIRGDDTRQDEANKMGADCYIALHSNAVGTKNDGNAQGTLSFYNGNNDGAKEFSQLVYDKVAKLTPTKDRGNIDDIEYSRINGQTPYAEVLKPKMANILLEVEFHDYKEYADWIVKNLDKIAKAIAEGTDEYLKTL